MHLLIPPLLSFFSCLSWSSRFCQPWEGHSSPSPEEITIIKLNLPQSALLELNRKGIPCIPQAPPQTYFISTQGTGQHQARLFGRKETLILCKPLTTLGHPWITQHRYPDVLLQRRLGGPSISPLYSPASHRIAFS